MSGRIQVAALRADGDQRASQHHRSHPTIGRARPRFPEQVYRIVNQKPELIALQVISAICDIFSLGPKTSSPSLRPPSGHARSAPQAPLTSCTSTAPSAGVAHAASTTAAELPKGLTPCNTLGGRPPHERLRPVRLLPQRWKGQGEVAGRQYMRSLLHLGGPNPRHLLRIRAVGKLPDGMLVKTIPRFFAPRVEGWGGRSKTGSPETMAPGDGNSARC